ncbi:hypothetical protein GCM10007860_27980 [Chitiniphilus shinanonensis]|uniref:DUF11 domain-containing protein n=1 Tax=Chitiniphilus shinanonensis TaxID=553088 RepID=A0ABQ6BWD6_9NEIS|nr:hypothetical protein [Chitiniphilus shinanonensis]GLS05641.1 hypothetical protein GCM10007860_27980 [Chitiniphilus shinanonensis]
MSTFSATFVQVSPYGIALTNNVGFPYEISITNEGPDAVAVDTLVVNINFGTFGHPVRNSVFVRTLDEAIPDTAFAVAEAMVNQPNFTMQLTVGFTVNTPDQLKSLPVDAHLVIRLASPDDYTGYLPAIENSIIVGTKV